MREKSEIGRATLVETWKKSMCCVAVMRTNRALAGERVWKGQRGYVDCALQTETLSCRHQHSHTVEPRFSCTQLKIYIRK